MRIDWPSPMAIERTGRGFAFRSNWLMLHLQWRAAFRFAFVLIREPLCPGLQLRIGRLVFQAVYWHRMWAHLESGYQIKEADDVR